MKVILASKSPRRRELLSRIYSDFEIICEEVDESLPSGMHPMQGVELLAVRKGHAVAQKHPDALVISSDTLVEYNGIPLGKPTSEEVAVETLLTLSGKVHRVHTGVAVHYKGRVYSGTDTAHVKFCEISPTEAREYVATGEPMDKAGAYAIQGIGSRFVEKYDGDYDAIVGLGVLLTKKLCDEALENE